MQYKNITLKMMNVEKPRSCAFCLNLGIAHPHDHTVRDFSKKDKPTICPNLLKTECGYCHKTGHTKKYCPVLKEKKISNDNGFENVGISSDKKRAHIIDQDGFIHVSSNNSGKNTHELEHKKMQKVGRLMSVFGALNIENNSDGNDSDEYDSDGYEQFNMDEVNGQDMMNEVNKPVEITWASVVSSTKKKHVFATQQELRDRLGIKTGMLWADEAD